MAKQRKQKQKDVNSAPTPTPDSNRPYESCCASVRSQKLCVAVDIVQQRVYGYTELTVAAPESGVIGLHARGLHIEKVSVDGASASFELLQQPSQRKHFQNGDYACSTCADAADICYSKYMAALDEEMVPELLIRPGEAFTPVDASQNPPAILQTVSETVKGNGTVQPPSTPADGTKPVEFGTANSAVAPLQEQWIVVRVDYWVEKPLAGAHFTEKMFHTNNQLRRARCWFPCVDSTPGRSSFSLEITVASEFMAVSNGKLLYQVYGKEGRHLKTYAYSMSIPVMANCISLVVAPLVVLPDRSNAMISHMCMPGDASRLQCTVNFFYLLFSAYEEYLGAQFPFGCYKQVFIDSDSSISSASLGASMVTLSSHFLVDERIIDQAFVTQVKLAHALAQQWFGVFITPEAPADAWLLEGLAGFLCDQFVKRYMGNNEARYRRFKANEAVCMADGAGAPVLSWPSTVGVELFGTETLGALGQIRAWKATAVVQMLEKQMGPEPFKKILQRIILRAQDPVRQLRTLSTKEFRKFANKLGNLERPYLKEFFPRWVESSGCPRLRMGFLYSKRRNMVELAVHRECTSFLDKSGTDKHGGNKTAPTADLGWPGMMSIRIHELDGMYDHPSLPMAGDTYQLLDIQCHSKLAGRRIPKSKKGGKVDAATEDHVDAGPADLRLSLESPLLWLRADPQMEYMAEIHLIQPEQMWINQLEKDRDVVGQLQAIEAMVALPRPSFAVTTALNNCLTDFKVFCRVRIEAAFALASTSTEGNSWMGLTHLIKFYKNCRCDPEIGLPKSNDFHDLAEYLVLESVPGAIALVRGSDGKSPVEATDFVLHILKHNDNSSNQFSDVFWLASVIESIGGFEFGQQNIQTMSKFLKQIDRFLQYDRLMPSYNSVLTISCIHTLTRLALKFSKILPLERLKHLLLPFGNPGKNPQQVRVTALQSVLEIEAQFQGLDSAVQLALRLVEGDPSLMVQSKLMEHIAHMSVPKARSPASLSSHTLEALLQKLDSETSFCNVALRHHLFSLLQILAGRSASLYRSENAIVLQVPILQKPPQSKPPLKETKVKSSPAAAKGKTQAAAAAAAHTEPIRLRFVPVRPTVTPKVEQPVGSASSSGKELAVKSSAGAGADVGAGASVGGASAGGTSSASARRIGKVKLRLKPASLSGGAGGAGGGGGGLSPMELSVGSLERGGMVTTTSQSPASVQVSAKGEPMVDESSQQSGHVTTALSEINIVGQLHVKEELTTPPLPPAAAGAIEEGEVESANDNVLIGVETMMPGAAEDPSQFVRDVVVVVGGAGGVDSSKGSLVDSDGDGEGEGDGSGGVYDGSGSAKDGTESLNQVLERLEIPPHENGGEPIPFTGGVPQLLAQSPREVRFPRGDLDADDAVPIAPGTSDTSDSKPGLEVLSAITVSGGGKGKDPVEDKKEKKDKREKKHKKDRKRHSRDQDEDSQNQDKKRSKENDIEYQERKRKRKEEKVQKKREKEGHHRSSSRPPSDVAVHTSKPFKAPENSTAVVPEIKQEGDSGQKIRLKFKKVNNNLTRP